MSTSAPFTPAQPDRDTAPKTVRIGPFTYSFSFMTAMASTANGLFGWCSKAENDIQIRGDLNAQRTVEVTLHEIFHGLVEAGNIPVDRDLEEKIAQSLGIGFTGFWRDNPEMVSWIESQVQSFR